MGQLYSENEEFYPEASNGIPIGTIIMFGSNICPPDFLYCDGSAISRETYSELFQAIGTLYGVGNGSTTFNLPNFTNRFAQCSTTVGTVKAAGLPEIYGMINSSTRSANYAGAFQSFNNGTNSSWGGITATSYNYNFYASRYNAIYGSSTTVQPPALTVQFIIKFR